MSKSFSLKRNEIIKSEKDFEKIISDGKAMNAYPLKLIYIKSESKYKKQPVVKIAISVPKKKVRMAVKRNRIKRLFREAYRTNKHLFFEYAISTKFTFNLLFIFTGKADEADFNTFATKIILLLQRLQSTNESLKRSNDTSA